MLDANAKMPIRIHESMRNITTHGVNTAQESAMHPQTDIQICHRGIQNHPFARVPTAPKTSGLAEQVSNTAIRYALSFKHLRHFFAIVRDVYLQRGDKSSHYPPPGFAFCLNARIAILRIVSETSLLPDRFFRSCVIKFFTNPMDTSVGTRGLKHRFRMIT
jgi:hypothetical protein